MTDPVTNVFADLLNLYNTIFIQYWGWEDANEILYDYKEWIVNFEKIELDRWKKANDKLYSSDDALEKMSSMITKLKKFRNYLDNKAKNGTLKESHNMKKTELIQLIRECIKEIKDEPKSFTDWKSQYLQHNPEQSDKTDSDLKVMYNKYKNTVEKDVVKEITDAERQKIYDKRAGVGMDASKLNNPPQIYNPDRKSIHKGLDVSKQKTKIHRDIPMTDMEYERLLKVVAIKTPGATAVDKAKNLMHDSRISSYITKVARINDEDPLTRLASDLEQFIN